MFCFDIVRLCPLTGFQCQNNLYMLGIAKYCMARLYDFYYALVVIILCISMPAS